MTADSPIRIHVGDAIVFGNDLPFVLVGGMNVLESRELALELAGNYVDVCRRLQIPFVFKASFDKANRSSIHSFRGPGMQAGLKILSEIKDKYAVPVLTDVHETWQCDPVAEVADIIQLPAFLSRQTDLVVAMARTAAAVNIKKAQFLAPHEMQHILRKFEESGNDRLMLCERGSSFGYNNLVVDMLGFNVMKKFRYPVMFDVTHSLQKPGGLTQSADGRRADVTQLARAGMSQGLSALFVESHPDPDKALCDGPCALALDKLEPFLVQMKAIDELVKQFPEIVTA
jgi:2-dehydro-3-deoxyphosphooctonate aldolase (KDO 8-P synthase)